MRGQVVGKSFEVVTWYFLGRGKAIVPAGAPGTDGFVVFAYARP